MVHLRCFCWPYKSRGPVTLKYQHPAVIPKTVKMMHLHQSRTSKELLLYPDPISHLRALTFSPTKGGLLDDLESRGLRKMV